MLDGDAVSVRPPPLVAAAVTMALAAGGAPAGDRGPCVPPPAPGEVGTVCGFRSPEDVEAVEAAGIMLVSQMAPIFGTGAGSLAAVALESLSAEVWTIGPPADGEAPRGAAAGTPPAPGTPPAVGDPSCRTPPAARLEGPARPGDAQPSAWTPWTPAADA